MGHESIMRLREWLPREKRKSIQRRRLSRNKIGAFHYVFNARVLLSMLSILLLLGSSIIFSNWFMKKSDGYFKIKTVHIEAQLDNTQAYEIERSLMPYVNQSFFNIDLESAKRSLLDISWIREASLKRQWPDIVSLTLSEQVPVAKWNRNFYINDIADIFSIEKRNSDEKLPELSGPDDKAYEVLVFYSQVAHIMSVSGLELKALSLNPRGAWNLITQHDIEIKLGTNEPLQRLKTFLLAYSRGFSTNASEIQTIDLRHSNGFTVRWRESSHASQKTISESSLQGNNQDV